MKQGQVGAMVRSGSPTRPLIGGASHRAQLAQEGETLIRDAVVAVGKSCGTYPDAELFERIRSQRARNISVSTLCEGIVASAQNTHAKASAVTQLKASLCGWIDALFVVPNRSLAQAWEESTVAQAHGDVTQRRALASDNVADINAAIVALETEIWLDQQMLPQLHARKRALLSQRSPVMQSAS